MLFWNSLGFFYDPKDVGNWSPVPLPFLNPAWISGIYRFTNCWRYTWIILSITLLVCSVQLSSLVQSCLTHCDPMNCSTEGLHLHHWLPEITQTHVHWISDAIQPSQFQLTPSPTFNISQHQGLFKWVRSSHQVDKVLEFQPQPLQWIFRTDFI